MNQTLRLKKSTGVRMREAVRARIRSAGVEITRWPNSNPLLPVVKLINTARADAVLDIGANVGVYGESIRDLGFEGRIVSLEPIESLYSALHARSLNDHRWDALKFAVGSHEGDATIHVAGNAGASSSLRPMLQRHRVVAPAAEFIGSESVRQTTLDVLARTSAHNCHRLFVKIDVQGYENEVLEGAQEVLTSGKLVGMQVEMSLVPLYEGAWSFDETLEWARRQGFTLKRILPGFSDDGNGEMLQCDGIFLRDEGGSRDP